ncbi:apoptosis inhibitory protein 5 [Striga asiatica]|uniref:Apoptosis inhibitory protein 5 n=1 Tax=Striga asiatica TaxID=4170 RepID=A0A5A7RKG8_STRAF|nr:apoptosis inhibitory protein 5 [Striga asiatica]
MFGKAVRPWEAAMKGRAWERDSSMPTWLFKRKANRTVRMRVENMAEMPMTTDCRRGRNIMPVSDPTPMAKKKNMIPKAASVSRITTLRIGKSVFEMLGSWPRRDENDMRKRVLMSNLETSSFLSLHTHIGTCTLEQNGW